nr:hypothetical protein Iba_chr05dCG7310 [Ipomoea batatas]
MNTFTAKSRSRFAIVEEREAMLQDLIGSAEPKLSDERKVVPDAAASVVHLALQSVNFSTGVADNCADIYPAEVVAATTGELHHAATATAPHHWSSPAIITTTKAANSPRFAHRRRPPTSLPPAAVAAAASPPSHSTTMITMVFTTAATTLLSLPPPTKKSQTRQNEEEDSSSSTMVVLIVDVVPPFGKHKATVACWTSSPPLVTANRSDSGNPTLRRNYDDGELGAASQVAISSIVFRRSPPPSPPLFFVGRSPGNVEKQKLLLLTFASFQVFNHKSRQKM